MKPVAVGGSKNFPLLSALSCATSSNCAVTGYLAPAGSSASSFSAFTEVWNGKAWRIAAVPWPTGIGNSYPLGVSCFGAHACTAVGLSGSATAPDATAASYDGTSRTPQPVPAPAKGRAAIFSDVSCLSAASCVAVGETGLASAAGGTVMTGVWNGTAWKLNPGF
jgi:hypothetical protein